LSLGGEIDALISQIHKGGILYTEAVREFRKAFIAMVLRENNGNQSKAARELGMHRNTLTRTASALRLDVRALRPGSRRPPGRAPSLSAVRKMSR
jgi:DNA-binding NtrC family response regulator